MKEPNTTGEIGSSMAPRKNPTRAEQYDESIVADCRTAHEALTRLHRTLCNHISPEAGAAGRPAEGDRPDPTTSLRGLRRICQWYAESKDQGAHIPGHTSLRRICESGKATDTGAAARTVLAVGRAVGAWLEAGKPDVSHYQDP